jgi:hypothetical protein
MKTPQFPDKLHRPHETKTRNLNRRGRKTRTAVTAAEVAFCAYFVLTGNAKQASLQAGYSAWWGYELLKMPRVQPTLREFERRKQDEAWDTARDRIVLTREFLDELFIQRIVSMRTHPKVGDLSIVKMFETGYRRTGDIQPSADQRRRQNRRRRSTLREAPLPPGVAQGGHREDPEGGTRRERSRAYHRKRRATDGN